MSDNLIVGLTFSFNREFNLLDVCKELNILLSDISSFSIQDLHIHITMTNGDKHKYNLMHSFEDLYMTDTDYNYPGVATYTTSEGPIKLIDSVDSSENSDFDNRGNLIINIKENIISEFVKDAYISATKNAPYNHSDVCEITHQIISMHPENEEIEIINQVESALEATGLVYIDREWVNRKCN